MNTRLSKPSWDNGMVCWVELEQPDRTWRRCRGPIGERAQKLRGEDGGLQGGRSYGQMRRTCWGHQRHEAAAQAL